MGYIPKSSPALEALQRSIEEANKKDEIRRLEARQKAIFNNMKKACLPSARKEPYVPTLEDECVMREYALGMYSGD